MREDSKEALAIFLLGFGIVIFIVYREFIYPAFQEYIESGQLVKDIISWGLVVLGILILGIMIFFIIKKIVNDISYRRYLIKKEELRIKEEIKRKKEEKEKRLKEEKERKYWEEIRLERERKEQEEKREREREEAEFKAEVEELVCFKRKYGIKAMPINENYSSEVIEKARQKIKYEIRKEKQRKEVQEEAKEFYTKHSRNTRPDDWQSLNYEDKEIWEKERRKTKTNEDSGRLNKALKEI